MSPVISINRKPSTNRPADLCGETRSDVRAMDRVMQAARSLWPRKTAAELSVRTGTQMRGCEYWLARRSGMSADSLAALLRSDEGFQILEAIIGDAKPVWWRAFKKSVRRADLRRQQAALAKALEEIEQAELDL